MRWATPAGEGGRKDDAAPFRADLEKYYRVHFGTPTPPLLRRAFLWARHTGLHCVAAYRLSRYVRRVAAHNRAVAFPLLNLSRAVELGLELVHHVSISAEVGPG
ncbi:MAG TPA: hypothetical protein VFK90_04465, partial [Anaeromyxobacter sp.]|nr:hypothetical protein [Anaeromyxobacter sp.]